MYVANSIGANYIIQFFLIGEYRVKTFNFTLLLKLFPLWQFNLLLRHLSNAKKTDNETMLVLYEFIGEHSLTHLHGVLNDFLPFLNLQDILRIL